MKNLFWYLLAAIGEIGGCFSFWAWLRMNKSPLWTIPGTISLVCFALILIRIDALAAGRAYASYGAVYIFASLVWLWLIEGIRPDRWDLIGVTVCLSGSVIILFGPRG